MGSRRKPQKIAEEIFPTYDVMEKALERVRAKKHKKAWGKYSLEKYWRNPGDILIEKKFMRTCVNTALLYLLLDKSNFPSDCAVSIIEYGVNIEEKTLLLKSPSFGQKLQKKINKFLCLQ